jgi:RNA polymerase sigma-70 factor (ECF subfamily)
MHSVLHRARTVVETKVVRGAATGIRPEDQPVLARYVHAIATSDVDAMIALIHADMQLTMPPSPTWIAGLADNIPFFRRMFERWPPGTARVEPIGVNGGAGFAFYRDGVLRAIEAVEVRDDRIYRMHHFMQPAAVALFAS